MSVRELFLQLANMCKIVVSTVRELVEQYSELYERFKDSLDEIEVRIDNITKLVHSMLFIDWKRFEILSSELRDIMYKLTLLLDDIRNHLKKVKGAASES